MKKLAGAAIAVVILAATLFWLSRFNNDEKPASENLAESSKAAFAILDSKITKCTVADFVYEIDDPTQPIAPLFDNLGNHKFTVTTDNQKAQVFFNQGIRLTYAFNHSEAHRSFMEVARLDPECAMAYWGQAYALGPNINDPLPDDERKTKAYEAVQKAVGLSKNASKKEKALILALSKRYASDLEHDVSELNTAYKDAMKEVVDEYGEDADVQTLYAAAIMNTMPWNYWDNKGNPNPGTLDGKNALEKAMEINPDHPGAHHYYIHMVELPKPDLGVPSAEKLGDLMPSAGHLVHMPSHIFIRVGRYEDAAKANIDAVAADEDYISQCYSQGMYPLAYYPHNIHFLWSAASMIGDSETAIQAAKKTAEKVPIGQMETLTFLQDYYSTPMLAYTRFGKWNEVLTIPNPGPSKHVMLIWHYTRGIAFLRKGNIKEAEEELGELSKLKDDPSLESLVANYTNPSSSIAKVAHRALAGEVAAAKGDFDEAINLLQEGVTFEDELVYSEPAAWHIPVRQTLGAVLLKADKSSEAEEVYRKDLEILRNNGWSLMGLHNSLKAQGKDSEAQKVKEQFDDSWKNADISITSSVL